MSRHDEDLLSAEVKRWRERAEKAEADLRELTEPISDAGHTVADGLRAEIEQWRGLAERRGKALTFLLTRIAETTAEVKPLLLRDSPPQRDICFARQYSDRMRCYTCDVSWDVNDPDPPKCEPKFPRP
jgi:hypothetical protein